jgi:protoporphyrinogen oxidase
MFSNVSENTITTVKNKIKNLKIKLQKRIKSKGYSENLGQKEKINLEDFINKEIGFNTTSEMLMNQLQDVFYELELE